MGSFGLRATTTFWDADGAKTLLAGSSGLRSPGGRFFFLVTDFLLTAGLTLRPVVSTGVSSFLGPGAAGAGLHNKQKINNK